jgi:hypothetical protein
MASLAGHVTCGRDRFWLRAKARRASWYVAAACERRGLDDHDRLTDCSSSHAGHGLDDLPCRNVQIIDELGMR